MLTAFEMRELEKPFSLPLPNSRKSMDRREGVAYVYIYATPPVIYHFSSPETQFDKSGSKIVLPFCLIS